MPTIANYLVEPSSVWFLCPAFVSHFIRSFILVCPLCSPAETHWNTSDVTIVTIGKDAEEANISMNFNELPTTEFGIV